MNYQLPAVIALVAVISLLLSRKSNHSSGFFLGQSASGQAPSLITLVFSQVTTWIFARSLLNAAILGFYYGIWGTLAYTAYYLSFFTGAKIVEHVRFVEGFDSVQTFLANRFGRWGTSCYNLVIGVRLTSEVFANLLVIGILFGAAGSQAYTLAIIAVAVITLAYSMLGGLHASLRTDLFQMIAFIAVLGLLLLMVAFGGHYTLDLISFKPFDISQPGPILLLVALLQVWSYPMHDPVMMDRGFLADRDTTRRSFMHAGWISMLCIVAFGSLGVIAGANAITGEDMNQALTRLLGTYPMLLLSASLIISAMSTLDSTLSSSAKLLVMDMKVTAPSVRNGRIVMAVFMLLGLALVFLGNKDLFSAVAVSGTASMYLVPVILFSLWGKRTDIPVWSYVASFVIAIAAAVLYFTESSGYSTLLGEAHKYTKLLWLSLLVPALGCFCFWWGGRSR
ncbi:sodium:proline symporter [Neptunomonas phycophila]|jgi:Na+/proline symporter|uniref:Sodium:proline symporter n=1 Tax=Neptunomonas phycophila TaxID=1572645 RepID=A0AAW7XFM0_9GAMM|nr:MULTISPECIES: sodium:proline symporter [Neptunomonas]MDN2661538.1 sodium:proline symporter [Neptunomonas sp. CHC150]MDO6452521.1 sodium:proline symporter [Neptunomonas phycophila]MDO6469792.1 sodium:proline symporter [Neptunomonas phycophila]MDO6783816.1 sodium:proline symporter [Neptunomonas phycophila]QLE98167.1 sodium:proline symporter [Neptunomonas phycophila]